MKETMYFFLYNKYLERDSNGYYSSISRSILFGGYALTEEDIRSFFWVNNKGHKLLKVAKRL